METLPFIATGHVTRDGNRFQIRAKNADGTPNETASILAVSRGDELLLRDADAQPGNMTFSLQRQGGQDLLVVSNPGADGAQAAQVAVAVDLSGLADTDPLLRVERDAKGQLHLAGDEKDLTVEVGRGSGEGYNIADGSLGRWLSS